MTLLLFCLLILAVTTDVRTGRIPNTLVMLGSAAGLFLQAMAPLEDAVPGGTRSLALGLAGMLVGFAALFPLYLLRAMGAGDVKLMMMVGAFLGPLQTVGAAVLTLVAGGVLAIVLALWKRSLRQVTGNLRFMFTNGAIRIMGGEGPRFEPLQQTAVRMPYAIAIAAGTVLQLVLVRSGGWGLS